LKHPLGHRLLEAAGVLAVIGIYWVRRIIRIEV
jgi:Flp pilus assembly protein TadB